MSVVPTDGATELVRLVDQRPPMITFVSKGTREKGGDHCHHTTSDAFTSGVGSQHIACYRMADEYVKTWKSPYAVSVREWIIALFRGWIRDTLMTARRRTRDPSVVLSANGI